MAYTNKGNRSRFTAVMLIGAMLTGLFAAPHSGLAASAPSAAKTAVISGDESSLESGPFYYEIRQEWQEQGWAEGKEGAYVPANRLAASSEQAEVRIGAYKGENDVLVWKNVKGWIEYEVEAEQDGLYELALDYYPLPEEDGGNRQAVILSVRINGEHPFREARSIQFERQFRDLEPKFDKEDNQLRSLVEELGEWRNQPFRDSEGAYSQPLLWPLKKGTNRIRLEAVRQPLAIKALHVNPPQSIRDYAEVRSEYPEESSEEARLIEVEAEHFYSKNSTSIQVQYDRDPLTTPYSIYKVRFNTIGGGSWYRSRQAVTWELDVPEDGRYKLAMRVKQNFHKNLSVFRSISIDGEIPFQEMKHYGFPYATSWQGVTLEDKEGEPYEFYLTKGTHTLSMEVNYEPFIPLLVVIDGMASEWRDISLDLRTATGNRVDEFRVWDVEKELPGLVDRLKKLHEQYNWLAEQMIAINGMTDTVSQSFESSAKDIEDLLKNPNEIPYRQINIGTMQEKLETQRTALLEAPLQVDRIYAASVQAEFPKLTAGFFQKLWGAIVSLFASFTDSNKLNEQKDEELNVWMLWGRDYVDELQQLADERFTPEHGIKVNVNLIQSKDLLILAKAGGILPDIALGIPGDMPFEMALRNAALDLSELPGAGSFLDKFHPGAMLPYYYNGGYYGVPETINFKVMFYRKDILERLKLKVPDTWEEVYDMVPTLLQNQANFYVDPNDFSYIFYQNGVEMYTPDGLNTGLDTPEAFDSFKQWTDLFNVHGMERQVQSFYNQFRKGFMPIGIADFNQYMQLLVAAPELLNVWGIAPVPGTKQPDGSIVRWSGGTSLQTTSAMLFRDTPKEKQELAWKFLQWYMSDDIQTEYGLNLEQYRGEAFRWNSANINAFVHMPWRPEDLQVILEQWRWLKDIPNVPGGYMTTRELSFAWNRATIDDENPRISLEKAVKQIKRELIRKQQEFRLVDEQENVLRMLELPQVTEPWKGVDPFVE